MCTKNYQNSVLSDKIAELRLKGAVYFASDHMCWACITFTFRYFFASPCSSLIVFVGGTAVGTGINTRVGFAEKVAAKVAEFTGKTNSVYTTALVTLTNSIK